MTSRPAWPPPAPHPGSWKAGSGEALEALQLGGTVPQERWPWALDRGLRSEAPAAPHAQHDLTLPNTARNEPAAPFEDSPAMSQTPSPRARRARRTEDEQIADLQRKIQELEDRKQRMAAKTSPVRKDFDRFKKHANKFVQSCVDHGRNDLANSVMALINTVERQVDAS